MHIPGRTTADCTNDIVLTADNVIDGEGDTQGWNRYSYVKGNPVVYKDPTGHFKEKSESRQYTYKEDEGGTDVRQETIHGGEVEKGDTLWKIAKNQLKKELGKGIVTKKHIKAKVGVIKDINGLKNDTIKLGQALITGKTSKVIGEGGLEEPPVSPTDVASAGKAIYSVGKLGFFGFKAVIKKIGNVLSKRRVNKLAEKMGKILPKADPRKVLETKVKIKHGKNGEQTLELEEVWKKHRKGELYTEHGEHIPSTPKSYILKKDGKKKFTID